MTKGAKPGNIPENEKGRTNPWGGNLLEGIDSDDLGGGPGATTFTVPDFVR